MKISKVNVWKTSGIGLKDDPEWIIDIYDEEGNVTVKIISDVEPEVSKDKK
jgi:hypothetical protein